MKKLFIFLSIIVLVGCSSEKTFYQESSTTITSYQESLEINGENTITLTIPQEWSKLDTSSKHFINLINTDLSSVLTIAILSKPGIYDPSIQKYLTNLNNLYKNDSVIKIIDSGIEGEAHNNIGYVHKNSYLDSSVINELEIHILLDNKILVLKGQNVDGSDPNNLKDILLQIGSSILY